MVSKLNKDSLHKAYILTDEHLLKHPFKFDGFFTSINRTKLTRTWRVVPYAKFPFREIMHYRRALSSKYRITPPPQCCRALISQYRIGIDYVTYGFLLSLSLFSLSLSLSLFLSLSLSPAKPLGAAAYWICGNVWWKSRLAAGWKLVLWSEWKKLVKIAIRMLMK